MPAPSLKLKATKAEVKEILRRLPKLLGKKDAFSRSARPNSGPLPFQPIPAGLNRLRVKNPDPAKRLDLETAARVFRSHLARNLFARIHRSFLAKSQGGYDETGSRWAKLRPATIARRPGHKPLPILIVTHRLERSLRPGRIAPSGEYKPPGESGSDQIFEETRGGLVLGSADPKAFFHHYGTRRMVARPLWPQAARLNAWLADAVKGATLALVDFLSRK